MSDGKVKGEELLKYLEEAVEVSESIIGVIDAAFPGKYQRQALYASCLTLLGKKLIEDDGTIRGVESLLKQLTSIATKRREMLGKKGMSAEECVTAPAGFGIWN